MVQYLSWVKGVLHGDFGQSIFYHNGVGALMAQRFPVTVHLGITALIFGAVVGTFAGLAAAVRRGTWVDKIITPLTYLGVTVPVFWLGILLIYTFGLKLHWLPISG